jgi:hypothetical protein
MASDLNTHGMRYLKKRGKTGTMESKNRKTTAFLSVSTRSLACWESKVSSNERSIDLK